MSDNDNDLVNLVAAARAMLLPELVQHVEEQAEKIAGSFLDFQTAKANEELAEATINLGCAVDEVRAGISFRAAGSGRNSRPRATGQARKIIEEVEEEARWRADYANHARH
jgi:hypothetical protein